VTCTSAGRAESETSLTELFAVDMLVEDMLAVDMLAVDMGLFPLSMVLGRMTDQI
jgi:hypothetical protein